MEIKNKPLSEWTLKEAAELCRGRISMKPSVNRDCAGCPLNGRICGTSDDGYLIDSPDGWELVGEDEACPKQERAETVPTREAEANAYIYVPGKPRLAEVLGVDVGEKFKVCDADGGWDGDAVFHLDAYGKFVSGIAPGSSVALCCAIQHPESIVRLPLTFGELLKMDGQPVWLNDVPNGWKCFIVNLLGFQAENGRICSTPCGVDAWGRATSLTLLAECGLYRHPQKEICNNRYTF